MKRLIVLLLLLPTTLGADALFREQSALEITLSGPLNALIKNREQDRQLAFTLMLAGRSFPAKLRTRGNFRLHQCDFPPLRLNLKTRRMAGTSFEGEDKLKLVTHCRNHERSEKDLLEEYLAYRMFGHLTHASLRVRLMHVRYEDTDTGASDERHAIALESRDALARRLAARRARRTEVRRSEFEVEQAALVFVFAYLIGNTDYSLVAALGDSECCHNVILLEREDRKLLLVPYDFDLSGIVDADYAKPNRGLRIRRVTSRLYRGYCLKNRGALEGAVDRIVQARPAFLAMIDALPLLTDAERRRKKHWLDGFYEDAEDREAMLDRFERQCL